MIFNHFVSDQH